MLTFISKSTFLQMFFWKSTCSFSVNNILSPILNLNILNIAWGNFEELFLFVCLFICFLLHFLNDLEFPLSSLFLFIFLVSALSDEIFNFGESRSCLWKELLTEFILWIMCKIVDRKFFVPLVLVKWRP